MWSACTSIGTCPAVCAASTRNGTATSRATIPISRTGCSVPVTLLPCTHAISRVFFRTARRMSAGSTNPVTGSHFTRVCSMSPRSASALYGRSTLLWSSHVVTTWSPGRTSPRMARFNASLVFSVKITWSGDAPFSSRLIRSRQVCSSAADSFASA